MESPIFNVDRITDALDQAVVHIAVLVPPRLKPNVSSVMPAAERPPLRLLFASVWLLAPGRQAPPRPAEPFLQRFDEGSIAVDRIVMSAEEAVRWYRSVPEELNTPKPLQGLRAKSDGIPLSAGRLSDFPSWPLLGVPMECEDIAEKTEGSSIPFRNINIIRYARRISDSQVWPGFLDQERQSKDCQIAFQFLERHMHVDFKAYPEYLGGLILAVPDCDVHSVRQFVDPKKDGSESLYVHVKPHLSRKIRGLTLTSMEGQEGMLTFFDSVPVPEDGMVEIKRPSSIHSSGLILTHEDRGVLMQTPMRGFLRRMNMTTELVERHVKVQAPENDRKKSPINEYIVEKKTMASSSMLGEAPDTTDAYQRLLDAKHERLLNYSARTYDQTWFAAGQRKEALGYIREKLGHARSSVLIADPYFSEKQVRQFLYAVARDEVSIKILTSGSAFNMFNSAEGETGNDTGDASVKDGFLGELEIFRASHKNSIDVRVANNESSLFHDRFLIVDGRVWILGSSLNSIGNRPTMIMRVPHGERILNNLIALYDNSSPLESLIITRAPVSKLCVHCGRDTSDVKKFQDLKASSAEEPDFDNG